MRSYQWCHSCERLASILISFIGKYTKTIKRKLKRQEHWNSEYAFFLFVCLEISMNIPIKYLLCILMKHLYEPLNQVFITLENENSRRLIGILWTKNIPKKLWKKYSNSTFCFRFRNYLEIFNYFSSTAVRLPQCRHVRWWNANKLNSNDNQIYFVYVVGVGTKFGRKKQKCNFHR